MWLRVVLFGGLLKRWAKMQYVPEIFGGKIPKRGVGKWVRVITVKPNVAISQSLKSKIGNFPS
jgi:hypothetical protein